MGASPTFAMFLLGFQDWALCFVRVKEIRSELTEKTSCVFQRFA